MSESSSGLVSKRGVESENGWVSESLAVPASSVKNVWSTIERVEPWDGQGSTCWSASATAGVHQALQGYVAHKEQHSPLGPP